MPQNRWRVVNEIFHAALEVPASERDDFLLRASEGDSDVLLQVERMLLADARADGYLESLSELNHASDSFNLIQPGDSLKGRFHIRQLLGEGGMGQVFEAWDEELKIRVALKVIRPEISDNPVMQTSFRREVRIARAITHPNVCRIYDLERVIVPREERGQQEILFLTMEYLEGETLAARVGTAGPLPLAEALGYGRQIASALDAAHSAGIVHRDVKPANIMLVRDAKGDPHRIRVVITDFGLARAELPQSELHGSSGSLGVPAGTVAYMAPEQMKSNGDISAATDIYAFGLVLFEMITGKRAFPSANLLTGIAQRLSGPPPSPRSLNPAVPEAWETVIQRCLLREASERFGSASDALDALEEGSSSQSHSRRVIPKISTAPAFLSHLPLRRRWLMIAAISVLFIAGVSLLQIWLRLYVQQSNSKVAPGALVYFTPVQNRTSVRKLDNLTELLKASLSQSAQIKLLDQGRVGDTLQLMTKPADTVIDAPTAREIAMRTAAVRVIFLSVTVTAKGYEIDVDIQQTDSTPSRARNEWKTSFPWESASENRSETISPELLHAVRNAADWIRAKLVNRRMTSHASTRRPRTSPRATGRHSKTTAKRWL